MTRIVKFLEKESEMKVAEQWEGKGKFNEQFSFKKDHCIDDIRNLKQNKFKYICCNK